ncbi:ion transporter [Heliorestis acidaminivorans]|uniref:Ion transporter n=1 Tax=Heliorestis acidaminivorans TaxID=553427 RepID=A0A6I0EWN1_9FIRM|nr:ion transporter [Heliorestis acidaminivorans]KAB2954199.1 ion transporter [Heliorestis acidaminivorans]
MKALCQRIIALPYFEHFIVVLIAINSIILGLETSTFLTTSYDSWFLLAHQLILAVFILEAIIKITAVAPQWKKYFGDGWNLFDFSIIILSLIPATGQFAMIARLVRLLRILRLVSAIPELRLIVSTLIRSIPSMGHVLILSGILFYIYGILGYHLFHKHDPELWGSFGLSLLTLFRVITLEDWTDVMYVAMDLNPYSWIYFVSFVVLGTFVVINLFIAIVLNNLQDAKVDEQDAEKQALATSVEAIHAEVAVAKEEDLQVAQLLDQIKVTQQKLIDLQSQLEKKLKE